MSSTQHRSNWSGSVRSTPLQVIQPQNIAELARLIKDYSRDERHVRVVGAGHSFTPIAQSNDILISLDNIQGVESIDTATGCATVLGGTRLKLLGEALFAQGMAQENLGDIDVQSIAGAISTGTHGTGTRFGTLATQVQGFTLITGAGEILE